MEPFGVTIQSGRFVQLRLLLERLDPDAHISAEPQGLDEAGNFLDFIWVVPAANPDLESLILAHAPLFMPEPPPNYRRWRDIGAE